MKGIIMELNHKSAVVMTSEGTFINVPLDSNQYQCGEEINVDTKESKNLFSRPMISLMTTAAIFLLVVVGGWAYNIPAGYVSIDINPSIVLTYNRLDLIIEGVGLNDDGEKIIESIEGYKNRPIDWVIESVILEAELAEYIELNEDDTVVIAYTQLSEDSKRNRTFADENSVLGNLKIVEYQTSITAFEAAQGDGKSVGIEMLMEKYSDEFGLKFEQGASVKEIMQRVKEKKTLDVLKKDKDIEKEKDIKKNINTDIKNDAKKEIEKEKNLDKNNKDAPAFVETKVKEDEFDNSNVENQIKEKDNNKEKTKEENKTQVENKNVEKNDDKSVDKNMDDSEKKKNSEIVEAKTEDLSNHDIDKDKESIKEPEANGKVEKDSKDENTKKDVADDKLENKIDTMKEVDEAEEKEPSSKENDSREEEAPQGKDKSNDNSKNQKEGGKNEKNN